MSEAPECCEKLTERIVMTDIRMDVARYDAILTIPRLRRIWQQGGLGAVAECKKRVAEVRREEQYRALLFVFVFLGEKQNERPFPTMKK